MPVATAAPPAAKRAPMRAPSADLTLETVPQVEERCPALRGRLRTFIHRADCGDPAYALLRLAIVRIGRRTWISRDHLNAFFESYRLRPPAPSNNPNPGEHLRKKAATRKRGR